MPRPYVEPKYDNQSQVEWVKLNELKAGRYPVVKTTEKMQSYLGEPEKLVVYIELLIDGTSKMIRGNGKLRQMCEGSHVCNISEGWILVVRGMVKAGEYTTRDVDLYQTESGFISQEVEDNLPF
jgi:hypothetical protein